MGRKSTGKPNRNDYITRTLEIHHYAVRYVVPGAKDISETELHIAAGGKSQADKRAQKRGKEFGTVIDITHTGEDKKLMGMLAEKFFAEADELHFETENTEDVENG